MKKLLILFTFLIIQIFNYSLSNSQWFDVGIKSETLNISSIDFASSDNGFVTGYGDSKAKFAKTTDGGATWQVTSITGIADAQRYFYRVKMLDINNIYITGSNGSYGVLHYSANGGTTWATTVFDSIANPKAGLIQDIFFLSPDNIILPASDPNPPNNTQLLRSTDKGQTWTTQKLGMTVSGLTFADRNNGYLFTSLRRLYRTTNSGVDWQMIRDSNALRLRILSFPSAKNGFIFGYYPEGTRWNNFVALKTTDSGSTWSLTYSVTGEPQGNPFLSAGFLNEKYGMTGGVRHFMFTNDSGYTWEFNVPASNTDFTLIKVVSDKISYTCGRVTGSIWKFDANRTFPIITLTKQKIWFDDTDSLGTSEAVFDIGNSGNADLVVSKINIINDSVGVFSLENLNFPLLIKQNDYKDIKLFFTPKQSREYTAKVEIRSNSHPDTIKLIEIEGIGKQSGIPESSQNRLFDVSVVTNESGINLILTPGSKISSGNSFTIKMIDLNGRVVKASIMEFSGHYLSCSLDCSDLPRGVYLLLINCGNYNMKKTVIIF